MSIGWNFPNSNFGEDRGAKEAGIETFKGKLFESLAKEICQNSLDVRKDFNNPVRIEFALSEVEREKIYGVDDLSKAIEYCKNSWRKGSNEYSLMEKADIVCKNDRIRVLRISDFNTKGLTGSNRNESSDWKDLVKSSGVSNKDGEMGGSFGIGKYAPFACSELRTIFYSTLDEDGLKAFQGVARLISFETKTRKGIFATAKGDKKLGDGYYGEKSNNSSVKDIIELDGFRRDLVGTDIYVIGFLDNSCWKNDVIKAVIEKYLLSILRNDLEVVVGDVFINNATIHKLIEEFEDISKYTRDYYKVMTDERTITLNVDFNELGKFELKILLDKNLDRRVLIARNNGMKIFDKGSISGSLDFSAVCILQDREINEYFRKMENPQHDEWNPERYSTDEKKCRLAKKNKSALFKLIKDTILAQDNKMISDEMDAYGVGKFMPDVDFESENCGEKNLADTENISDKTTNYTPIEKSTFVKVKKGCQLFEGTDFVTENYSQGEFDVDGMGAIIERGDGKSNRKFHDKGNLNLNLLETSDEIRGSSTKNGDYTVKSLMSINPLKLRIIVFGKDKIMYKLSFVPNKSAKNSYIEISISGEQSNYNVEIESAKYLDNTSLICKNNRILVGSIKENESYTICYTIKYKEKYSMEVDVYGYEV